MCCYVKLAVNLARLEVPYFKLAETGDNLTTFSVNCVLTNKRSKCNRLSAQLYCICSNLSDLSICCSQRQ